MGNAPFDFDTVIDRKNTNSEKWDKYGGRDIIPLWVADMDFRSPPAVLDALADCLEHGMLGYVHPDEFERLHYADVLLRGASLLRGSEKDQTRSPPWPRDESNAR